MRETCARVLAAALMMGAIATVVGMSALSGTSSEVSRPIAAPPSSQERSVRLTAHIAPARHRPNTSGLVTAHTNPVSVRPHAAPATAVIRARPARSSGARRQLAGVTKPTPQPQPQTPATPASQATPATDPPAPATPAATGDEGKDHGHGRGHAYGHDKQDE